MATTTTAPGSRLDDNGYAFLGREFLTWLWYRCEVGGGMFPREAGDVGVVFDDYISMVSPDGEPEQSILKKGSPHRAPEAGAALLVGKVVGAARLHLACEDRSFQVTIQGDTLDLRSVKYPTPTADDLFEKDLERLAAMEELGEIVDDLYGLFLSVRATAGWSATELPAIAAWIQDRVHA